MSAKPKPWKGGNRTLHGATRGHSPTPEYRCWVNMRSRCEWPKNKFFHNYGGRGISVCDRWGASFQAFLEDMGPRPTPKHTIDRINNDGDYEPGNCRWATRKEQNRNRSINRMLTFRGETMCLVAWAERLGMKRETIRLRLERGWDVERSLSTPTTPNSKGTNNALAKLNEEKVREIRRLAAGGMVHRAIGDRFDISQTVVSAIVRRDRWKHVE